MIGEMLRGRLEEALEPFTGKPLTRARKRDMVESLGQTVQGYLSEMLTYGPEEVGRIARECHLSEENVREVLRAGGGLIKRAPDHD